MFDKESNGNAKFQGDIGKGPKLEMLSVAPVVHNYVLKIRDICISGKDSRLPSSEVYYTNKKLIKKFHNLCSKFGARTNDIEHLDSYNLELSLNNSYSTLLAFADLVHSSFSFWALLTGEWKKINVNFEHKWNVTHNYCDSIWITSQNMNNNRLYHSKQFN